MKKSANFDDDDVDPYDIQKNTRNRSILERVFAKKAQKKRGVKKSQRTTIESVTARYQDISADDACNFTKFDQFPLSSQTLQGLEDSGFVEPTDIQRQSILLSLQGHDIVGAAKTGSGKTLALLIPVLECLWRNKFSPEDGLGALIISPTRELAYQIFQVLNKIGRHHDFSGGVLIGGTDVKFELERLANVNIVVCTPGRLLQHMDENSTFYCGNLQMLVIDEADRILDLGFKRQMNSIVENLPTERQTLLFSATQTTNIKDLVRVCTKDPDFVSVHEKDDTVTPDRLTQSYIVMDEQDKVNFLWSYLSNHRRRKTLIFVTCCTQARFLTQALCSLRPGLSLMGLWGTMNQSKRVEVFHSFDENTAGAALIATDIASRGLDFKKVDYVIQLDCPATVEDYIHRVGRTARMNKKGEGILIVTPTQEEGFLSKLRKRKIDPELIDVDSSKLTDIRVKLTNELLEYPKYKEFAQKAIVAYAKAYHSMPATDVFDVQSIDFAALAASYGLKTAPRIRFLRKKGIDVSKPKIGDVFDGTADKIKAREMKKKDTKAKLTFESLDGTAGAGNPNLEPLKAELEEDDEDDDDVLKVSRRNVFDVKPTEDLDEDKARISSKKKQRPLTRVELAKKALKRGALETVERIKFDSDGNRITNPGTMDRFDISKAKQNLEAIGGEDRAVLKAKLRAIRKTKKAKEKLFRKQQKKAGDARDDDTLDLAEFGDEKEAGPDLSWLPNPDYSVQLSDDEGEGADEEPPSKKQKKKRKSADNEDIRSAEEKALALLGL